MWCSKVTIFSYRNLAGNGGPTSIRVPISIQLSERWVHILRSQRARRGPRNADQVELKLITKGQIQISCATRIFSGLIVRRAGSVMHITKRLLYTAEQWMGQEILLN